MEKLTLDKLKKLPAGSIIDQGIIENSPDGIYITDSRIGDKLRWVAKRGVIHDWTIYTAWEEQGLSFCLTNGQKVHSPVAIKKLIQCDDEAFAMYRF